MRLGELIQTLKEQPQDKVVKIGFHNPHIYWASPDGDLAFEPKRNCLISEMLELAKAQVGRSMCPNHSALDWLIDENTSVYLAFEGEHGVETDPILLAFILGIEDKPIKIGMETL